VEGGNSRFVDGSGSHGVLVFFTHAPIGDLAVLFHVGKGGCEEREVERIYTIPVLEGAGTQAGGAMGRSSDERDVGVGFVEVVLVEDGEGEGARGCGGGGGDGED
jgi:hypothetical protein